MGYDACGAGSICFEKSCACIDLRGCGPGSNCPNSYNQCIEDAKNNHKPGFDYDNCDNECTTANFYQCGNYDKPGNTPCKCAHPCTFQKTNTTVCRTGK